MKKIKVCELKPGDIFKGEDNIERIVLYVPDRAQNYNSFVDLRDGHIFQYMGDAFTEEVYLLRKGLYNA